MSGWKTLVRANPQRGKDTYVRNPTFHPLGFTLVEVLVALGPAGLVVAVTGRIAVQSLHTREFVSRQVRDTRRMARLEAVLGDDVDHRLNAVDDLLPTVVTDGSQVVWESFVLSPDLGEAETALHVARRPSFVRYRLVSTDSNSRSWDLIREVTDRTNPGARMRPETIATDLTSFQVQWLRRGAWQSSTSTDLETTRQAEAVRFQGRWKDSPETWQRIFILSHER